VRCPGEGRHGILRPREHGIHADQVDDPEATQRLKHLGLHVGEHDPCPHVITPSS